jgi:hypothetical protein
MPFAFEAKLLPHLYRPAVTRRVINKAFHNTSVFLASFNVVSVWLINARNH